VHLVGFTIGINQDMYDGVNSPNEFAICSESTDEV
jgi:hypothetical protein